MPLARAAIAHEFGVEHPADRGNVWLHELGACFVTLMHYGALRGCIGSLESRRALLVDVEANAVAAAFSDPRFAPLTESELEEIDIEVSLLSPMQPLQFRDEADALVQMQPGSDGIVFRYGGYRSTFLPQVWQQLTTPREFLAQLKLKAGLPADFWGNEVQLQRYTVNKYAERDVRLAPQQ